MAGRSGFGTWFYGFLVGGVVGVGACAAAALFITNAPIPFINKVNQASEKINPIANGAIPDPNAALNGTGDSPANAPKSKVVTVEPQYPNSADTANTKEEVKQPAEETYRYVVQAGAVKGEAEAENLRAELGLLGFESRIIKRVENGTTWYRVRLGPYGTNQEANDVKTRLMQNSFQATVGRVK